MDPYILRKLNAERRARRAVVHVTDLGDGRDRIVREGDTVVGPLGEAIAAVFRSGKSGAVEVEGRSYFLNVHLPPARIVVIGAVHISQALAAMAKVTGFDLTIIDPRTAFADPARFGAADAKLIAEWPQDALPKLGLDPYTAVLTLAHVAHIDDEALKLAVRADCLFVAALGSSRNHAKRRERLLAAGITEDELARIKAPIGLDIGAQTPAEIAVSIMAEIILAVRGTKKTKG